MLYMNRLITRRILAALLTIAEHLLLDIRGLTSAPILMRLGQPLIQISEENAVHAIIF